jgi:hypothetical protein
MKQLVQRVVQPRVYEWKKCAPRASLKYFFWRFTKIRLEHKPHMVGHARTEHAGWLHPASIDRQHFFFPLK